MRRILSILRSWMVPAILVALAALATVPWTFWVITAAYERDVNEKAAMLAQRIQIQLSTAWFWGSAQQVLEPLKTELFADSTVQAVVFLDAQRKGLWSIAGVRRHESIPLPRNEEEIKRLLNEDPNSYRQYFRWAQNGEVRGIIYLDLSRTELRKHFWVADGPLLRNVIALTATGIVIVSAAGMLAYHLWGRATRQRQRAELEQQGLLAERGLAAAVLAHEVRNPLAALRFQLHSLRRHSNDPQRVGNTANTIDAELLRIQQLLQEYLAHEKAQALRVAPVELCAAVRGLQSLMGELLRESDTRLLIRTAGRDVVVACDPHALRQVLMNLVINAQQAMGRGGAITISVGEEEGSGMICVADTGPGIPEEMRDRLFKPFATSKQDGSGIGLALVKRFVDNFGGSVTVESEPGRGAKFYLRLPLARRVDARGADEPEGEIVTEAIT